MIKSGKSQDKEKPVVTFLQPFCGFQHILEGPEVNCGDLECDLDDDLEHALDGENKEDARDGDRVGGGQRRVNWRWLIWLGKIGDDEWTL